MNGIPTALILEMEYIHRTEGSRALREIADDPHEPHGRRIAAQRELGLLEDDGDWW